jgi:hypothetical protein
MWMLESPIGVMAMTKTQFLCNFLEDIIEKEHLFIKRILKSIFIVGKKINKFLFFISILDKLIYI